jgi:hypothetical protein
MTGLGLSHPSEKYESQFGVLFPIYIYIWKKNKMFQTTNQMTFVSQEWSFLIAQQTSLRYRNWKQQDLGCEATKFKDPKQLRKTMRTLPLLPCKIGLITCDVFPSFLL